MIKQISLLILLSVATISTQAALIGRLPSTPGGTDYQAYYDDEADLTWLKNANASGTVMNWHDASAWVAGLDVEGITGWRLPHTQVPDDTCELDSTGFFCTGSEMGNLFYNVLGGVAYSSIDDVHNSNYDLFTSTQEAYWSATEADNETQAYVFIFNSSGVIGGVQAVSDKTTQLLSSWAVHDGDVAVVPVPATAWLFGIGLAVLAGFAKKINEKEISEGN